MNAKEALLLSLKRSNQNVLKLINELEDEISASAYRGLRSCEGSIVLFNEDINISDVITFFEILEYKVSHDSFRSPFNGALTYNVKLDWESE